jgi:hypothetical protein
MRVGVGLVHKCETQTKTKQNDFDKLTTSNWTTVLMEEASTTCTLTGLDDNVRACVLLHLEPRDLAHVPP